jgi:hypothetical protein
MSTRKRRAEDDGEELQALPSDESEEEEEYVPYCALCAIILQFVFCAQY